MKSNHKEKYKRLGLNIAYYRKLNGFTQETLAEKLDVDRTTVSKIELATSGVSLDLVFDIAELFDIPVEKLFVFR
ncbi:MAG: helix-turn-helix transcriptional regulator [Clostridia bacterium]|nr:helix-turn-helix transcriptional regulator [Clostridia bacterium]